MTAPVIDLDSGGLAVSGVPVPLPIPIATLSDLWGPPRRWDGPASSLVTWDDVGIYGHLFDDDHIKTLCIQFLEEQDGPAFTPTSPFSGTLRIDGTTVEHEIPGAEATVARRARRATTTAHGVRIHAAYDDDSLEAVEMTSAVKVLPPVPRDKYAVKPAAGTALVFTDLNLKLAVLDELMYQQEVIEPMFVLSEFVRWHQDRSIDVEAEAGRPIAEALAYFERLEIDEAMANRVRRLVIDAGNEIYQQIAPQWDGEDDAFDIGSWDDLALLPHLDYLDFISLTPDRATVRALRDRGLDVET